MNSDSTGGSLRVYWGPMSLLVAVVSVVVALVMVHAVVVAVVIFTIVVVVILGSVEKPMR